MIAFIITLALSLNMSRMIWSKQILEYPFFAVVSPKEFQAYHRRHNRDSCPISNAKSVNHRMKSMNYTEERFPLLKGIRHDDFIRFFSRSKCART
jgi:hypothetical protein